MQEILVNYLIEFDKLCMFIGPAPSRKQNSTTNYQYKWLFVHFKFMVEVYLINLFI